jgi:hypothetical protein
MKLLIAKKIVMYFHIYKMYLQENSLDDDSNSISVPDLISFVEDEVDKEDQDRYLRQFNF